MIRARLRCGKKCTKARRHKLCPNLKICEYPGCKRPKKQNKGYIDSRFCCLHKHKATIAGFLDTTYGSMKKRVEGRNSHDRGHWKGKPILPRDVFMTWSKNHPDFLSLYKRYVMSDFDRKLAPSVNRMNSNKGYVLGNIEWMTTSQNCALAGGVTSMRAKKAIYSLLGVSTNEKR